MKTVDGVPKRDVA